MERHTEQQPTSESSGRGSWTSSKRRRAREFRVRCVMLFSMCLSTFVSVPVGMAADPRPFVPPLACCDDYKCPCHTNTCVGLPCIPVCDPAIDGATAGPAWHLTLQEAINTAMSNSEAVRNLGLVEAGSRNDIVRSVITTYDSLEAYALASGEWGIFDPLWTTEMIWDKQDIPPGTSFSGIGNRPPQLDTADFYTSLEQLLPIGTRVRATMATDYLFNPAHPPQLNPNPQYFSYNQYGISQPLLRGFGVDVTMAPIKIACAEAERTDWQFKQEMLAMVRSIETTYWALYAQQQNLRALEAAIPAFREVVRLRQEQATGEVGTESEVARAQSDLYLFEQRRLEIMSRIAEQQLVLRNLMGLPPNDCRDIVLLAVPTTTRPTETLPCAVQRAINSRPDVLRQRLAVYIASQERLLAENNLQPQLDLNGFWQTNGLGQDLDQSFESKDTNDFESWQMGVFFQIPLGRRQGRAELQAAQLRISRERAMLEQTAHQASYEVVDAYRRLNWTYQQLEIAANRERALNQWSEGARATFENPPPGVTTIFALEMYLNNLRNMTDASFTKNALLADYNSALARLAEVTGSLLENRLVQIAGDASDTLPSQLPPAEIQLPEAVAPATPVQPQPVQPAPAEPAPAQPQPQGVPPQAIVPPTASPLAEAPQSQPLPSIQMPQSLQAQDAYANLPITPAPATTPAVEAPIAAAPVMEPAPIEAPMPAPTPLEMAQEPPVMAPEPIVAAPAPMSAPSLEMPQSMLPEPARMAMRPEPVETPDVEAPLAAQPMAEDRAAPMPRTETPLMESPALRQPAAVARQRAVVPAAPMQHSIVKEGPSLAMPNSVAAPPESFQAPPRQAVRSTTRPIQEPTLRMPSSISAAPQRIERPRQVAAPANESAPSVNLRIPTSVQGPGAAAPSVSQHARPLQPVTSAHPTQRSAAGPMLTLPGSVRPATAEALVRRTNSAPRAGGEAEPAAVRGAALQFPSSVDPVTR